ncbi:MAG: hypothetical protein J7J06_08475, partial [Methanosarcinales archaeon]|nr:hypothetical protein [Methanosarcinales archaeon]
MCLAEAKKPRDLIYLIYLGDRFHGNYQRTIYLVNPDLELLSLHVLTSLHIYNLAHENATAEPITFAATR